MSGYFGKLPSLLRKHAIRLLLIATVLVASSCATYYERNIAYQESIGVGDLKKAEHLLDKNKKMQKPKNRLLYLVNKGVVDHLQQEFEASNATFNEADLWIEDSKINFQREALALITNPEARVYKPETFESILIHYYKALNYMNLGQLDEARVEARRINLKLQQLGDRFKKHKDRYTSDAFAHILMGLTYDANGEHNDAFIAYRNAYDLYMRDGSGKYFGAKVPQQLKEDLIRTAHLSGFRREKREYEQTFGMTYEHNPSEGGELLFFWHNGFGPVKSEWSINFFVVQGAGGLVTFENREHDLSFPFYASDDDGKTDFDDLRTLRVAFPKYVERKPVYTSAQLVLDGERYSLDMAENVNEIAFRTLQDRFVREMGTSLLRLAIKKVAEMKIRQENEALGALAAITNAVTEKADTRHWQTLPYAIHYSRVPLKKGLNTVSLQTSAPNQAGTTQEFEFKGEKGKTHFFPFHTLATQQANLQSRWYLD